MPARPAQAHAMKPPPRSRREIFVFTTEEKRASACLLAAVILGLLTQHYRAMHPRPASPPTAKETRAEKSEKRIAAGRDRGSRRPAAASLPTPAPNEDED